MVEPTDLVYFDPPYKPRDSTSSFVEYSAEGFGQAEQKRLKKVAKRLYEEHDCHVVISNSPPMKELYQDTDGFNVHTIGAKRMINSDGDSRGEVGEIIVTTAPDENRRERTPELDTFD